MLDAIRVEMARDADFDADLFAQNIRSGYVREAPDNTPKASTSRRARKLKHVTDEPELVGEASE
jgi:hypothetical protein